MDKLSFDEYFRGFHFVDCAVRSRSIIYLLGRQEYELEEGDSDPDESEVVKRFSNIFLDRPESERYGCTDLTGFRITNIEVSQVPQPHAVAVDYKADVFARAKGLTGLEDRVPFDDETGPQRGGIRRLRSVDGHVYGAGGRRSVCRREGPNHWVPLWDKSLPLPKVKRKVDENDYGFDDIHGFSANDLYAVGGEGDVWHYDGKRWKQIPFPSNMDLYNVCCGGDGQVYIGGRSGAVFRGRENRWEKIHDGGLSLRLKDMEWYQDRVWCTNDYGVWTIKDGKFEDAGLPLAIGNCAGRLAVGDGVMVLAGMYGAAMYDGQEWQMLVDLIELYRRYGK